MALADDLNTLRTQCEKIIDFYIGGHTDQNLADYCNKYPSQGHINNETVVALLLQILDRVYDLENP